MENFDKLNDNFMSEIFGLENEYDILNKQAKVCNNSNNEQFKAK